MDRLRNLREDNDLTQQNLADYLGCNQTTYSRYETGETSVPIDILKRLAIFYDVSIDYLICLTDEKKPYKRNEKKEEKK